MFNDGPLFFSSLSENEEKIIIFFLICFPQVVPIDKWNASLTIVTKISYMKAGKCSLIVRKRYEILFSWKQKIFPDMFLGTCRMQFRQQLKKFRQQAEKVCSTSKNDRRSTISLEVFLHNCSYGQVEWEHSDKSDENSWTEGRKTYAHCPKMKKETKLDEKFFFHRSVPMVTLKAILLNPLARVPRKA